MKQFNMMSLSSCILFLTVAIVKVGMVVRCCNDWFLLALWGMVAAFAVVGIYQNLKK